MDPDPEIIDTSIYAEMDPETLDICLYEACEDGNNSLVVLSLINMGADVNCQIEYMRTPLMAATVMENSSVVELLLENNAEVDLQDEGGNTALEIACRYGSTEIIELLLKHGANIGREDALVGACHGEISDESLVQSLILLGLNVNHSVDVFDVKLEKEVEWSPLMAASRHGHINIVKLLLEHGADVDGNFVCSFYKNFGNSYKSPLVLASSFKHIQIVKLLVEHGAEVGLDHALVVACEKGIDSLALSLINKGVDVNSLVEGPYGTDAAYYRSREWSPLGVASYCGQTSTVKLLLKRGLAEVNLQYYGGLSALKEASSSSHIETAKLLLDHGAQVDLDNSNGITAMNLASSNEMLDLLMTAMIPLPLVELLQPISTKWRNLGVCLGLSETILNTCQTYAKEYRLVAMLNTWSKNWPYPTWRALTRAVKSVDTSMVQRLEELVDPNMREYSVKDSKEESDIEDPTQSQLHLAAVKEAIKKKGKLEHTLSHGAIVGPAGSGKSSLMLRLVGEMPSSISPSTGVANRIVQIEVQKSSSIAVSVFGSSSTLASRKDTSTWLKILYDEEAIRLMTLAPKARSSSYQKRPMDSHTNCTPQFPTIFTTAEVPSTIFADSSSPTANSLSQTRNTLTVTSSSPTNHLLQTRNTTTVTRFKGEDDRFLLPSGYVRPMTLFKSALHLEKFEKLRQHFENSWSLYLTDSGGQMEFQEVLPLLVSGPSLFFITFRLNQDLQQRFTIEYRLPDGGRSKPYQSTLTVEEAILQTLASVASMGTFTYEVPEQKSVPLKPKVLIVGTHKDKVDEAKIKEIDEYLKKVIKSTSHYHEDLVEFASESRLIYTVNNLSEDDSDFVKIRLGVERAVEHNEHKISFPSHWLIFSLVLRQQTIEDQIISYDQCFAIAKDCGISDHKELNHALWFLHTKIGLVRHFPIPGLSDFVIRDPQILFDQVTHLIVKTFTFENVLERRSHQFKKKGIFSLKDFAKVNSKLSNQLIPPEKLLMLLKQLRIIAPFEKNGQKMYFMPCVLAHSEIRHSQSQIQSSDIPPLLISFQCGYCPKGLFGALIVYLLSSEMRSKFKWELQTDQIFRDQVSFRVSRHDVITLNFHPTFLELIHFRKSTKAYSTTVEDVCNGVRRYVKKGIKKVSSDMNLTSDAEHSLTFYCQDSDCVQNNGPHPASEIKGDGDGPVKMVDENTCSLWCRRYDTIIESSPPAGCSVWFGRECGSKACSGDGDILNPTSATIIPKKGSEQVAIFPLDDDFSSSPVKKPRISSPEQPSISSQPLPELCDVFKLLLPMASEWQDLAVLLSIPHSVMEEIRQDNTRVRSCLRAMLSEWLKQTHTSPSWSTLAEAVELLGNQAVAQEIRHKFK